MKKRILPLLLSLAMVLPMAAGSVTAYAKEDKDSGFVTSKTATYNESDKSYTVTLETYATGEKTTSTVTKEVPTDIVLVLDLSQSMKNEIEKVTYTEYTGKTNEQFYELRHNGGSGNLWYKLEDGKYISVSVTKTGEKAVYEDATSSTNGTLYYNDRENLYALVGGEYVKVSVTKILRDYTYTLENGTTIATGTGSSSTPGTITGTDDGKLWRLSDPDDSNAVYTYSYTSTDSEGTTVDNVIATSTNGSAEPTGVTLYSRTSSTDYTRIDALVDACEGFADSVAKKSTSTSNHRIAVVGFNGSSSLYIGGSKSDAYGSAFQDMSTEAGQKNVAASIAALKSNMSQGTMSNLGMQTANSIFAAYSASEGKTDRNKVIVLFTDGIPGSSGGKFDNAAVKVAETAISQANTSRTSYGATVYSVAVIEGADPTSAGSKTGTEVDRINWYLQNVSNNKGEVKDPGYYLVASDADSLNEIFQKIASQIETGGATTTLDENAVVKDIISPYFTMPENTTDVSVYTADCNTSTGAWGDRTTFDGKVTIDSTNRSVSVSGFSFKDNWYGKDIKGGIQTYHGKKLIIEFKVKARDGFLGGNGVETNTSAGIYENSDATTPVVTFEQPKVDVPIPEVTVTADEKDVYLKGQVTPDQLKSGVTVKVGNTPLDLSKENYGLETWQNAFVDITCELEDEDGNAITAALTDLVEDTEYSFTVKVSPRTTGTATEKEGKDGADICVFTPHLTFKDSEAYYGESLPDSNDYSGNLEKTEWKNGERSSKDTGVTMLGGVPALVLTYTPDANVIAADNTYTKQDVPVKAAVKIGTSDVSEYTTFLHDDCDGEDWTGEGGDPAFQIHVNTCTLTISKSGGASDEPYVFTILKDGEDYTETTIEGNGSSIIYELPVGTYSIKEDTGWSWRYTPSYGSNQAVLTGQASEGNLACTNTKNVDSWLNGFSKVVRNVVKLVK